MLAVGVVRLDTFGLIVDSRILATRLIECPMEPRQDILTAFQKLPKDRKSELQRLIDEYETACELSQGPRPDRSAHWTTKALDLEDDLRKRLGLD